MAQGVIDQRIILVRERELRAAAKPVADALRYGRAGAWMRARIRAVRRGIVEPIVTARKAVALAAEPVGYKLWRFACAAKYAFSVAAESIAAPALRFGRTAQAMVQEREWSHIVRRAQASLLITGCAVLVFTYGFYGMGLEVTVDGHSLGYVDSQQQFERAVVSVNARASELLNVPFALSPNVTYRFTLVNRSQVFNSAEVESMLFNRIPELKFMYVLSIDGEQIAGVTQPGSIEAALNERLDAVASEYDTVSYLQDVSVSYQLAPARLEVATEDLSGIVNSERRTSAYGIAAYDDIDAVARDFGMSTETLMELNPQIEAGSELAGHRLLLNHATPQMQIKSSTVVSYDEEIEFEVQYVDDPNMYTGRERVDVAGENGTRRITASVNYVDGRESDRDILDNVVTKEPVTKVIAVGTLEPPVFIRPYYGKFTSGFKSRTLFGVTRMHTGIDLAGPIGSPVVASCAGTVIFSGNKGDYGKAVVIDHGHGITTLYAHNSRLLVSVGQKVKQGEQIAKLGNTGRSTGPHVHFEIRINNNPVNPMNYVK